jgi:lysophospholipase L1-like esterase
LIDVNAAAQGVPLTGPGGLTTDGFHPNAAGSILIAETILGRLGVQV